jgi:peptidoglycan/LPS O-acetylase OafA/YrhL
MLLFGCALGVWANPALDPLQLPEKIWKWLLVPACLAAMAVSILWHNLHFHLTWYFTLQGVAISGLLPAAIRFPHWMLFRWLNWRPVAFMGAVSYTLYLIHDVALRAIVQLWPQSTMPARAIIALLVSLLVAVGMYWLVEQPCARLRARLHDRRIDTFAPSASASTGAG